MNAKISVFAICDEVIIYLLLYDLHECTLNSCITSNKRHIVRLIKASFQQRLVKVIQTI